MISHKVLLRIIYLIQVMSGILGNNLLFCFYSINFNSGYTRRSIDPLLIHLSFANTIILLFRGVPKILEFWEWGNFLDDIGCKIITYLQRVFRGLSLCSTSLLSVFQMITICLNNSMWTLLKVRSHKCILPCCLFCWVLNLLTDLYMPFYITGPSKNTNKRKNLGYCFLDIFALSPLKVNIWNSLYDSLFVGIMVCNSAYMVVFLYRHRKVVEYIHSSNPSLRVSSEIKATKAILLLVSTFVCFNTLSGPFIFNNSHSNGTSSWENHATFLSIAFQSISPFVLIKSDNQIHKSCSVL